jgi:hypothetical protein
VLAAFAVGAVWAAHAYESSHTEVIACVKAGDFNNYSDYKLAMAQLARLGMPPDLVRGSEGDFLFGAPSPPLFSTSQKGEYCLVEKPLAPFGLTGEGKVVIAR